MKINVTRRTNHRSCNRPLSRLLRHSLSVLHLILFLFFLLLTNHQPLLNKPLPPNQQLGVSSKPPLTPSIFLGLHGIPLSNPILSFLLLILLTNQILSCLKHPTNHKPPKIHGHLLTHLPNQMEVVYRHF